ncbi:MAG: TVP38/TMEM64 family protein [Clostridia bacterium]|nr:TVP38/TMEM64 family protein [Clostridia bacterium]
MAEKKKGRVKGKLILLGAILAAVILVLAIPSWRAAAVSAIHLLSEADLDAVKAYIRSFGSWAVAISMALMVLQSIAAPIPAFVITLANAGIFGWAWGAVISWAGAMLGAYLCFFLARFFGRDLVEKLTGKGAMESIDSFFTNHGAKSIFIARLLPFVPFDPISYAAGLTGMGTLPFLAATGLGQLPATIVYSYAGSTMLSGNLKLFFYGLCALMAIGGVSMLIRSLMKKKRASQNAKEENS